MFFLFSSYAVVISLVFTSVAPVALISSSCLRVGLAQAQRAGLILLPSRNKHMQVTSISGMLHVGRQLASIFSNQQIFMCHNRFDPTPGGRKTRLGSHSSKTVIFYGILSHCLRVYVFSRGSSSNQGTGALIHGGAKEITMFFAACVSLCADTYVVVTRPNGRESTDYALVWSLVSVVGKPGPSMGARTRTWAEVKVRPRPLCERAQARRQN